MILSPRQFLTTAKFPGFVSLVFLVWHTSFLLHSYFHFSWFTFVWDISFSATRFANCSLFILFTSCWIPFSVVNMHYMMKNGRTVEYGSYLLISSIFPLYLSHSYVRLWVRRLGGARDKALAVAGTVQWWTCNLSCSI